MRALLDTYGAAVAARTAAALTLGAGPALDDCKARETAAREALEQAIYRASGLVGQAVADVEAIAIAAPQTYADDPRYTEGSRANFERPHNARRAFTLKDAKPLARCAARQLREAWELLDPPIVPFR